METYYISLLTHILKLGKNSDTLSWVVNCIIFYYQYMSKSYVVCTNTYVNMYI